MSVQCCRCSSNSSCRVTALCFKDCLRSKIEPQPSNISHTQHHTADKIDRNRGQNVTLFFPVSVHSLKSTSAFVNCVKIVILRFYMIINYDILLISFRVSVCVCVSLMYTLWNRRYSSLTIPQLYSNWMLLQGFIYFCLMLMNTILFLAYLHCDFIYI